MKNDEIILKYNNIKLQYLIILPCVLIVIQQNLIAYHSRIVWRDFFRSILHKIIPLLKFVGKHKTFHLRVTNSFNSTLIVASFLDKKKKNVAFIYLFVKSELKNKILFIVLMHTDPAKHSLTFNEIIYRLKVIGY